MTKGEVKCDHACTVVTLQPGMAELLSSTSYLTGTSHHIFKKEVWYIKRQIHFWKYMMWIYIFPPTYLVLSDMHQYGCPIFMFTKLKGMSFVIFCHLYSVMSWGVCAKHCQSWTSVICWRQHVTSRANVWLASAMSLLSGQYWVDLL